MNILLIDVDSKMPNLALMKLSAWHKTRGDRVVLNGKLPMIGKVYISCIFMKNKNLAFGMAKMYNCEVVLGGSGINLTTELPYIVEHALPDYSLYNIKYSMGFTSRGCIRQCSWCVVPQKEGKIRDHAPLKEFTVWDWQKLILFDNNFLVSPKWHENLQEIIAHKTKVCFTQGLDIRLIDNENARLLAKVHYTNRHFNRKRLYFAWDIPKEEDKILQGIEILKKCGHKPQHQMFYVLTNYNTTQEQDFHRTEILIKQNIKPYIMIYNKPTAPQILKHYQRYINRGYHRFLTFQNYQTYHK